MDLTSVVRMPAPALSLINRGQPTKQSGELFMETLIYGIWKYLGGDWTEEQAQECARMMYAEYHWLTLAELKHFSLKCKQGKFECQKDFSKFSPKHMAMCFEDYEGDILPIRAAAQHLKPKEQPAQLLLDAPEFDPHKYVEQITEMLTGQHDLSEQQKQHTNITPEQFAKQMGINMGDIAKESFDLEKKVVAFTERLVVGEQMTSEEDLQFYANNKLAIEELLQRRQQHDSAD